MMLTGGALAFALKKESLNPGTVTFAAEQS